MRASDAPWIGDLVQDDDGRRLVVTDERRGQLIVRTLRGRREWPVEDLSVLIVLARRGTWNGLGEGREPGQAGTSNASGSPGSSPPGALDGER